MPETHHMKLVQVNQTLAGAVNLAGKTIPACIRSRLEAPVPHQWEHRSSPILRLRCIRFSWVCRSEPDTKSGHRAPLLFWQKIVIITNRV